MIEHEPQIKEDTIKVMPDKETLEAFMEGMHGDVKVVFNSKTGEFEWLIPRDYVKPLE